MKTDVPMQSLSNLVVNFELICTILFVCLVCFADITIRGMVRGGVWVLLNIVYFSHFQIRLDVLEVSRKPIYLLEKLHGGVFMD